MSMRKALVVLGMVAFAAASFAKAPVISGIPDIVIGDTEDQSATYDNNWFRYQNAFNILTYAKDVDSPAGNMFFTFLEETTSNDLNITIDAVTPNVNKSQVPLADATDPGAWGTHEITNYGQATRDYLLTFVDMVRSNPANQIGDGVTGAMFANPRRANGTEVPDGVTEDLPWHNTEGNTTLLSGASRTVQIFAADDPTATEVGSDIMTVISRNYANDALSGGLTTQYSANFASGAGTLWIYEGAGGLGACTSGQGTASPNGYISIQSPGPVGTGGLNYGRWYTARQGYAFYEGQIPYVANVVYAARYLMSHNVDTSTTRRTVPALRLGLNQVRYTVIVRQLLAAQPADAKDLNPQVPDQGELMMYKVPFSMNEGSPNFSSLVLPVDLISPGVPNVPVDLRTYDAYFDVLDADAGQGGTWTLHNFDVVTFPRPADMAVPSDGYGVGQAANFVTGWTVGLSQTAGGRAFSLTQNGNGSVQVNDPGAPVGTGIPAGNYYMWEKLLDRTKVAWEGGTMIRTKFGISVPNATDRTNFHTFRLRLRPALGTWWVTEWLLNGDNNGDNIFLPNDPIKPPTGSPFTYETYTSSQVVDDTLLTAIHAGQANGIFYDQLLVGMDFIHAIDAGAANPAYDDAITYTMHTLTLEVLDETL